MLSKLGIEEGEINKIILKQIAMYFIIPIVIAMIGFFVFIFVILWQLIIRSKGI
ncbi:MAG: hypothetical protein ACRCXA_07490 [Peptostreptococcaceae bacterium]